VSRAHADFHRFNCRSRGDETQIEEEKLETPHVVSYKSKAALGEPVLRLVTPTAIGLDE
jgi:hypothetical protein